MSNPRQPIKRRASMRDAYAAKMREQGRFSSFQPGKRQNERRAPEKRQFKPGKRTLKRKEMNAELNKLGIRHCEIQLSGCMGTFALSWAHSQKSRFLITNADWLEAARACAYCHNVIEAKSHEEMRGIVVAAIGRR